MQTDSWRGERHRHGGADEIPLPIGPGRLWLCGKHFVGPDAEAALVAVDADTIVCLNQQPELIDRYPAYVDWLRENRPTRALWHPIPDLHAPAVDEARVLVAELVRRIESGESLLVHCGAGIGRAGTVAAAVLLSLGITLDDALATVAEHRAMAGPEAGAQAGLLASLAVAR